MKPSTLTSVLVPLALALVGCKSGSSGPEPLAKTPQGLPELTASAENPLTAEKAHLGKILFFDPRLSSTGQMSCSTCHQHELGWADGQQLSKKANGEMNNRNSPSLYNVAYQPYFYWDGRAPTLEKNIEAAWKNQMGGDGDAMAKKLAEVAGYKPLFEAAFKAGPTAANIVDALASFVRTLKSGDSTMDRGELDDAANRGKKVFEQRCQVCHVPPLYTDNMFHNIGVGDKADPGRGKQDPTRMGAFKTPGLRAAAKTKPFFHDGSAKELRDAVAIMAKGGIENENLDPVLKMMRALPPATDKEIDDLVAFVNALASTEKFEKPVVPN